jgi:hypothetical protein
MAKQLWDGNAETLGNPPKSYATYANAVRAAEKVIGHTNHRYLIAVTPEGRFFPVAIGMDAIQNGVHFHMCVAG